MSDNMNQISSKTWAIILIVVVALIVFVGLFYFLGERSGNILTGNPGDTAEKFIDTWHFKGTLMDKSLAEKISSTSDLLTRDFALSIDDAELGSTESGVDPATCLLAEEGKVRLTKQEVSKSEGTATLYAVQTLEIGGERNIVMEMIASGGAWRINSISCDRE